MPIVCIPTGSGIAAIWIFVLLSKVTPSTSYCLCDRLTDLWNVCMYVCVHTSTERDAWAHTHTLCIVCIPTAEETNILQLLTVLIFVSFYVV